MMVLFAFWLFIAKWNSTDTKSFDHKDGKFKLPMSMDGGILPNSSQQKMQYQLQMYNFYQVQLKNHFFLSFLVWETS